MPIMLNMALAAASVARCTPLPEAGRLVATPTIRWLMVGEAGHGSNEIPSVAAGIVCAAIAHGRPVHVALEYAARNQPYIDRYLTSDGRAAARNSLLSAPLWDRDWADGKSSKAMLRFIEWLRVLYHHGHILGVLAFDVNEGRGAHRERLMAEHLQAIAIPPGGIAIVLTGGFHARKRDVGPNAASYTPAAGLLPAQSTFSLSVQGEGGHNWSCRDEGCGLQQIARTVVRTRSLRKNNKADRSYDAVLDLGVPTTASFPAVSAKK